MAQSASSVGDSVLNLVDAFNDTKIKTTVGELFV